MTHAKQKRIESAVDLLLKGYENIRKQTIEETAEDSKENETEEREMEEVGEKQKVLEILNTYERLEYVSKLLSKEIEK